MDHVLKYQISQLLNTLYCHCMQHLVQWLQVDCNCELTVTLTILEPTLDCEILLGWTYQMQDLANDVVLTK
jgi:hypothetical protein